MKRSISVIVVGLLFIGGLSFSGCGGSDTNDSGSNNNSGYTDNGNGSGSEVSISHSPFVRFYSRNESRENGTNQVVKFADGVEIPQNHDYILFGQGSIDKSDNGYEGDNALFARVSSKDGALVSAKYVRYVKNAQKNLSEYFRGTTLSYDLDGLTTKDIVLVGDSRTDGTNQAQSNELLITVLDGNGDHKWSKLYAITDGYLMNVGDVAADSDGTFWVVYNGYVPIRIVNGSVETAYLGVLLHIDAKTGEILLSKHIGNNSEYRDIVVTDNRIYITGKAVEGSNRDESVLLLELDKSGEILSANKYTHENTNGINDINENGVGLVYKNGKLYIAYQRDGWNAGILKIDASSKNLDKAVRVFTNSYGTYYRDFEANSDSLYLSANNAGFYKTDLNGNIDKVAMVEGGWKNGIFFDSGNDIVALGSNGAGGLVTSIATKFSDSLQYCGINTRLEDPSENATDVTNEWSSGNLTPSSDLSVAMATNNSGTLEVGSASGVITEQSQCDAQ